MQRGLGGAGFNRESWESTLRNDSVGKLIYKPASVLASLYSNSQNSAPTFSNRGASYYDFVFETEAIPHPHSHPKCLHFPAGRH